jgi:hypothetical protein
VHTNSIFGTDLLILVLWEISYWNWLGRRGNLVVMASLWDFLILDHIAAVKILKVELTSLRDESGIGGRYIVRLLIAPPVARRWRRGEELVQLKMGVLYARWTEYVGLHTTPQVPYVWDCAGNTRKAPTGPTPMLPPASHHTTLETMDPFLSATGMMTFCTPLFTRTCSDQEAWVVCSIAMVPQLREQPHNYPAR